MILFAERPPFDFAWHFTDFHVLMGGMGDDTAMLIAEMYERGYEPDEIVFCDTGSEFPHTYRFITFLQNWCIERNWSKVTVLKKYDTDGNPLSVIATAEQGNTLPAAAFGKKSCSLRFKTETADKYFNNHPKALAAWGVTKKGQPLDSHTGSILRIVGINADEPQRAARWAPQDKWVQVFPLCDWGIGERERAMQWNVWDCIIQASQAACAALICRLLNSTCCMTTILIFLSVCNVWKIIIVFTI